jgi:hypothetical protein
MIYSRFAKIALSLTLAFSPLSIFAQQDNLVFMGASNTNGTGSSLPLDIRVKSHLKSVLPKMSINDREKLEGKKVLIAVDYFFHTNFRALDNPNALHAELVEALVRQWSEQYDLVIVGLLPLPENLSANAKDALIRLNPNQAPKGLYTNLTQDGFLNQARTVNKTLQRLAKDGALPKGNFVLAPNERFFNAILGFPEQHSDRINSEKLFSDTFHVNDKGQATYINRVILPVLSQELGLSQPIKAMPEVDIKKDHIIEVYKKLSLGTDAFANRKSGAYFAKMLDLDQSRLEQATLEIPASFFGTDGKTEYVHPSDTDKIYELLSKIDSDVHKTEIHFLRGIALVMHLSSESGEAPIGFPVSWRDAPSANESSSFMMNLTQLAYLNFVLPATELSNPKAMRFQSWGSDYWKSYGWTFGTGLGGRLFRQSLPSFEDRLKKDVPVYDIPGSNYLWTADISESDPKRLSVTQVIFPMLRQNGEVQEVPTERLATLKAPWLERVPSMYPDQVKLIYKFDLEVIDTK